MEIKDITFSFDLKTRLFREVELKITIDIDSNSTIEAQKNQLLNNFKQIETYFDNILLKIKGIKKEVTGTEYTSFLDAGYVYRTEDLRDTVYCMFRYSFGIRDDKIQIPTMDIQLRAINNYNYWIMENMLGTLNFRLSENVSRVLERMRLKLISTVENQINPSNLLNNFNVKKIDLDFKSSYNKITDYGSNISSIKLFEQSKRVLGASFEKIVKKIVKKQRIFNWWFILMIVFIIAMIIFNIYKTISK
jgi:hypothetical protein